MKYSVFMCIWICWFMGYLLNIRSCFPFLLWIIDERILFNPIMSNLSILHFDIVWCRAFQKIICYFFLISEFLCCRNRMCVCSLHYFYIACLGFYIFMTSYPITRFLLCLYSIYCIHYMAFHIQLVFFVVTVFSLSILKICWTCINDLYIISCVCLVFYSLR